MSKKKKVTYSLIYFLCSLKASKRNCFAFYAFYAFRKRLRGIACLLFMLFMSEGLSVYFWCFLWVKVVCLLFNVFWVYKNIWMKVACLHFVLFMLFLCVKSFCKKTSEIIPNNLIYITTVVHFIEYCLLGFKKVRKCYYHKKWGKGEGGERLWSSKKFLIASMFWTVGKRLFWVVNFIRQILITLNDFCIWFIFHTNEDNHKL